MTSTMSGLERLRDTGVIAVIRAPGPTEALRGVEALVDGGVTGIEITFSTPAAPEVIATLAARYGEHILLGAGTILTTAQSAAAVDAGARFLVSPGCLDDLAAAMTASGRTTLLGALTPSEVMTATALGADAVKLFPSSLGGVGYLRSLRGPFPDVPLVPTGGVDADNLGAWLDAGALAVGAGGDLCSPADLMAGRWADLTDRAATFSRALSLWRENRGRP